MADDFRSRNMLVLGLAAPEWNLLWPVTARSWSTPPTHVTAPQPGGWGAAFLYDKRVASRARPPGGRARPGRHQRCPRQLLVAFYKTAERSSYGCARALPPIGWRSRPAWPINAVRPRPATVS